MGLDQDIPKVGYLRDSVQIFDERTRDWEAGWEARFRRQKTVGFFNAKALTITSTYTSDSFYCAPYKNALLLIDMLDTTGAPTDILISVEFSDDGINWRKYNESFYSDLRWEDTGAPYNECYLLPILAQYVRFKAVSQGASTSAYFTLTLKVVFNGM